MSGTLVLFSLPLVVSGGHGRQSAVYTSTQKFPLCAWMKAVPECGSSLVMTLKHCIKQRISLFIFRFMGELRS